MTKDVKAEAPKDRNYPAYKWHPKTGEAKIFNAAHEVPEGWLDTHPSNVTADDKPGKAADGTPVATVLPLTRKEIIAHLEAGGISFKANGSAKDLYSLLETSLLAHLKTAEIEIPEGADVPALLALVPPTA